MKTSSLKAVFVPYDPPWPAKTCSWCNATTKWWKQFGELTVCRDCATIRSTEDWIFFCDACEIGVCLNCGTAIVGCGDYLQLCKECAA